VIYAAGAVPILVFLFIALPLLELYVILQVGQAIGVLPTIGLMLITAIAGGALARSQGRSTWRSFNLAMKEGRVPGREILDGAMIIFGGALLLSPGFITDVLGIALLLPPARAGIRRLVRRAAARTPTGRPVFFIYERFGRRGPRPAEGPATPPPGSPSTGSPPPRPRRDYDVEGTAREVGDEQLPEDSRGERTGGTDG
jgi:UPF0716 protein FxsA